VTALVTDGAARPVPRGREAAVAAILDAAYELFAARGYNAVSVRAIAERAGVSHALVHRYLGSKGDIYRAVLTHNEDIILSAAPDDPDLLATTGRMLRRGLAEGRTQGRLVVQSALRGVPFDRSSGRFAATERLVELAERAAASAPAAERVEKDLDPRLVVACVVALFLGWGTASSWILPAVRLDDMDEAEVLDGVERVIADIFRSQVPGVDGSDSSPH
jgi:TetR/AcrR family transcriptional regulator, repressor for neighboring sulfatase